MLVKKSNRRCAAGLLLGSLSLLLFQTTVRAISLEELGIQARKRIEGTSQEERELDKLADGVEGEEWEINQVFLASKLAYMVTKGEKFLGTLPWFGGTSSTAQVFNDLDSYPSTAEQPVFKRVLTRTTNSACYIAHMNPFSIANIDVAPDGFGPFGIDLDNMKALSADDLLSTTPWPASDADPVCSTRAMLSRLLPYTFMDALDAYVDECVASGKRIIHTGHSYGGALATLVAAQQVTHNPWLITFGAPPIFLEDDCSLIAPERNVRIINTEVATVFPDAEAVVKEPMLTYDIVPSNLVEKIASFVYASGAAQFDLVIPPALDIVTTLGAAGASSDAYLPFPPLHPLGGATLLPPFPFRKSPSSVFLEDVLVQASDSTAVVGPLFWYKDFFPSFDPNSFAFFPNFKSQLLYPVNTMRKYYSKVRELYLQNKLSGISSDGFEHGTYCQDNSHCLAGFVCSSPPGNITTMCLSDSAPFCDSSAFFGCSAGDHCVDGLCFAGEEGDLCFQHTDCDQQICVKGRCSTGAKGQPCQDKFLDCSVGPPETFCNLRHFDFYKLCWFTDQEGELEAGGSGGNRPPSRGD